MEFLSEQKRKNNTIVIADALVADLAEIGLKAKALDLDCQDLQTDQFIVAREKNNIVGFGRIKKYDSCIEVSTVGVIAQEQRKGIGTLVVKELLKKIENEVYLICVIPEYFSRFGFVSVKEFPNVLLDKCNFCHSFGYKEGEVFVMKYLSIQALAKVGSDKN